MEQNAVTSIFDKQFSNEAAKQTRRNKNIIEIDNKVNESLFDVKSEICDISEEKTLYKEKETVSCDQCDFTTEHKKYLKDHIVIHIDEHKKSKLKLKCDKCDFRTVWKTCMRKHIKVVHTNKAKLKCDECEFTTVWKKVLKQHKDMQHAASKSFSCDNCDFKSERQQSLSNHLKMHDQSLIKKYNETIEERNNKCRICSKEFPGKLDKDTHMEEEHGVDPFRYSDEFKIDAVKRVGEVGILKASEELNMSKLTVQRWVKLISEPKYCSFCGMSFGHESRLKIHEELHKKKSVKSKSETSEKQLLVDKQLLSEKSKMKRMHTGETMNVRKTRKPLKEHQCAKCQNIYAGGISKLNKHMEICKGLKEKTGEFQCEKCPKTYANPHNLKYHMEGCTGSTTDFQCDKCSKSYTNPYRLKYHMACCTGSIVPRISYTDQDFIEKVVQQAKETSVLDSSKLYKVPHQTLCNWIKQYDTEKRYKCENCHRMFLTKNILKIHMKIHKIFAVKASQKQRIRQMAEKGKQTQSFKAEAVKLAKETTFEESCKKNSISRFKLRSWIKLIENPIVCEICSKSFERNSRYKTHMLNHNPQSIMCEICSKKCTNKVGYARHMMKIHPQVKDSRMDLRDLYLKKYSTVCNNINNSRNTLDARIESSDDSKQTTSQQENTVGKNEKLEVIKENQTETEIKEEINSSDDSENSDAEETKEEHKEAQEISVKHEETSEIKENQEEENIRDSENKDNEETEEDTNKEETKENKEDERNEETEKSKEKQEDTDNKETESKQESKDIEEQNEKEKRKIRSDEFNSAEEAIKKGTEQGDAEGKAEFNLTDDAENIKSEQDMKEHRLESENSHDAILRIIKYDSKCVECTICHKMFSRDDLLLQHITYVHKKDVGFFCQVCKKRFFTRDRLLEHERIHTGEKPFQCEHCYARFCSTRDLIYHKKYSHSTGNASFVCDYESCSVSYDSVGRLRYHKQSVHSNDTSNSFVCEFKNCSKTFKRKKQLTAHIKIHTGEKKINGNEAKPCNICGNKVKQFRRHAKTHLGIESLKSYQCDDCGKLYTNARSLLLHEKIVHLGQKEIQCEYCDKTFTRLSSLKVHKLTHTKETPYRCEHCSQGYKEKRNLMKHIEKQHRIESSDDL